MKYISNLLISIITIFLLNIQVVRANSPIQEIALNNIKNGEQHFIIKNVRLYDGNKLIENTDIEINNGKVLAIGQPIQSKPKVKEIDGKGKTLLPGLIDAHTHVYASALSDALIFGVTTELDMFTHPDEVAKYSPNRENIDNNSVADLFSSSYLATAPGGHGTEYGFEIPVLTSVDETKDFVENRILEGADYIKIVYNAKEAKRQHFPSISKEILKELIAQTHAHDLLAVVHIDNHISAQHAIELGANGLVHGFLDQVIDDKLVALMKENKAFMIPTLSVLAGLSQLGSAKQLLKNKWVTPFIKSQQKQQLSAAFPDYGKPKQGYKNTQISVKKLTDAGVAILAGTDAPNPGTTHGISLHEEIQRLVGAGLSNQQAIHSATGAATQFFPVGDRGTLKVGGMASMILINGNPFADISLTLNIEKIWKNGHLIQRIPDKNNEAPIEIKPGIITGFNKTIRKTSYGNGVIASTDQLAGGKSLVNLSLKESTDFIGKYLHVNGELKTGFMVLWGGISFIPGQSQLKGVDLSQLKTLKFAAKGGIQTKELTVMLFQSGSFIPSEVQIDISSQWKGYAVKLSDFKNVDLTDIVNVSIVRKSTLGKFEFMLDNLSFAN